MQEQFTKSIIVKGDVSSIYQLWANFENFPSFMKNIKSVTKTGERMSHWVMQGPLGIKVEWDAETVRLEPNQRISWRSLDNGGLKTTGQVVFSELPQNETQITVTLQYVPPAGMAGEVVADLFKNPEKQLEEDLYNFKKYAEGMHAPTGHQPRQGGFTQ